MSLSERRSFARGFAPRALTAAAAWWALTGGASDWDAWLIGVPSIVAAAWMSAAMLPPFGWSWPRAIRFAAFFVRESWLGGLDVAKRALAPRMPLAPGFVEHELGVEPDLARVAVINTSSLLPGSLVVDSRGGDVLVHVLDVEGADVARTMDMAEARIAAMLRLER